ncbi:MAG: SRPBCC family protein [Acidobacteria bacterium]|nr:SRPBCC family protein [Acidobacteriota bacterium]
MSLDSYSQNDALDLILERVVDVPRELVWRVWTEPEHLKPWFCPKPWTTPEAVMDVRPGGIFKTVLRSPEGQDFPYTGCYLDVVPKSRLVWTSALLPEYRPAAAQAEGVPVFTTVLTLSDVPGGTRYVAHVMHRDEAGRMTHEKMGFHEGWGTMVTQMAEYAKTLR